MVKGFIRRNDSIKGSCILCAAKKICDSPSAKFNEILKLKETSHCSSGDYFEYISLIMLKSRRF